jgi:hypothetical protein
MEQPAGVKLDLDYLEDKTRYAMSVPTCVIAKWELAALVEIAREAERRAAGGCLENGSGGRSP